MATWFHKNYKYRKLITIDNVAEVITVTVGAEEAAPAFTTIAKTFGPKTAQVTRVTKTFGPKTANTLITKIFGPKTSQVTRVTKTFGPKTRQFDQEALDIMRVQT